MTSPVGVTGGPVAVIPTQTASFTPTEFLHSLTVAEVRARVPPAHFARMEEAQMKVNHFEFKLALYSRLRTRVMWSLGLESLGVGLGAALVYRGYQYQEAARSIFYAYTGHWPTVSRFTTPYAIGGFCIIFFTSFMILGDLAALQAMNKGREQSLQMMSESLSARDRAYSEGLQAAAGAKEIDVEIN